MHLFSRIVPLNNDKELLRAKKFAFEQQAVWYREGHFKQKEVGVAGGAAEVETDEKEQARELVEYIKVTNTADPENFKPKRSKDLLFGVELEIRGPAAGLYLQKEAGLQLWKMQENQSQAIMLVFSLEPIDTPQNIHRRDFYKGNPRRTIEPLFLRDTKLGIKREVAKGSHLEHLIAALDEQFMECLDIDLLGGSED